MAISRVKTWVSGEILYAAHLNAEFDNIVDNQMDEPASMAHGDIIYRGASNYERLAAGTAGQALTTAGADANPAWAGMTTQGDIEYHNGTTRTRLAAGTAGQALTTTGASSNPTFAGMTTAGDIEYHNGTTRTRLAIGTAYQLLQVNSGATALEYTSTPKANSLTAMSSAGLGLYEDGGVGIFIEDSTGYVGIGITSSLGGLLHIYNSGLEENPLLYLEDVSGTAMDITFEANHIVNFESYCHSDTASRLARFRFMKSRGTQASATIVQDGDYLGAFNFFAYDGDSYENVASIICSVDGVAADEDVPAKFEIATFEKGGAKSTWLTIPNNGEIKIHHCLKLLEKSADPAEPGEGECIIWLSDGTGKGVDGDLMVASQAAGITRYGTLFDHSTGGVW